MLRDRVLLVVAALAFGAALLVNFLVLDRLRFSRDAQVVGAQMITLLVFEGFALGESPWHRRQLRVRWPVMATFIGLPLIHLTALSVFVSWFTPGWRIGGGWLWVTSVELVVCDLVLSAMDHYCRMDRRPPFTTFLSRQLSVLMGRIEP